MTPKLATENQHAQLTFCQRYVITHSCCSELLTTATRVCWCQI